MALRFIIGNSGAGNRIRLSACDPGGRETSGHNLLCDRAGAVYHADTENSGGDASDKGILNIDVLSFERLAFRVLEEVGGDMRRILEETGKNMVLQKLVQIHQKDLVYLKNQMKKPGYLDEVKSLISEFMQYEVDREELDRMQERCEDQVLLSMKLQDVTVLYNAFREYLSGHYMTGEEVLDVLAKQIPFSEKIRGSVFLLDGFTGFTPVQNEVVRELLAVCREVAVTVTMDVREPLFTREKPHQLFYMSHRMIRTLSELAGGTEDPVWVRPGEKSRFSDAPALRFLEQNLFRYRKEVYDREQEEIFLFSAAGPHREMRGDGQKDIASCQGKRNALRRDRGDHRQSEGVWEYRPAGLRKFRDSLFHR